MVEDFLSYLRYEKNYSEHTISAYSLDLGQVEAYLKNTYESDLGQTDGGQLRSWMVAQLEGGISPNSLNRKVSALKSYYKWLKKTTGTAFDPTLKLSLPKRPQRLPVFVEERSLGNDFAESIFDDDFEGRRNEAIVEMLYHTGIRSAELIGLTVNGIDHQMGTIKVIGKRNKERIIPIGDSLKTKLLEYQTLRTQLERIEDDRSFFLTAKGKKLYPKLVYRVVNDYISKISSVTKKSPHVLRHTFATHLLNKGADINAIKELLGHSSLAATQVYTHNTVEKLIEVYRNSHPKG